MMLAAPAKLGVPYEIGLKSINLACATLMIWLLEFKTKLPEPFKVILPFSYFLCYQYGVTSRPYALMVAAMLLVAINWKTRDEKPWREALSMMLLCLTSSYGLVIAGMFAANWVVRFVWQERSLIRNRRRFIALLALLAAAMAILIDVMPAKDVYSGNFDISGMTQPAPLWIQICNSWLLLPAEALFTSTVSDTNLVFIGLSPTLLYTGTVSCLMWAPLIHISRRRHNAMLLLSSYTVMCLVFAQHFSMHHLGILLGFFIAVLAIDCDERRIGVDDWPAWCDTMADQFAGKLGVKKARNYLIMLKALALGAMLISVYWTINASNRNRLEIEMHELVLDIMDSVGTDTFSFCYSDILLLLVHSQVKVEKHQVRKVLQECWKLTPAPNGLTYTTYLFNCNRECRYEPIRRVGRFYTVTREQLESL